MVRVPANYFLGWYKTLWVFVDILRFQHFKKICFPYQNFRKCHNFKPGHRILFLRIRKLATSKTLMLIRKIENNPSVSFDIRHHDYRKSCKNKIRQLYHQYGLFFLHPSRSASNHCQFFVGSLRIVVIFLVVAVLLGLSWVSVDRYGSLQMISWVIGDFIKCFVSKWVFLDYFLGCCGLF